MDTNRKPSEILKLAIESGAYAEEGLMCFALSTMFNGDKGTKHKISSHEYLMTKKVVKKAIDDYSTLHTYLYHNGVINVNIYDFCHFSTEEAKEINQIKTFFYVCLIWRLENEGL